ncbi:MAG TPA: DUF4159 domain-containing protein [Longimicrobiales bacterium]|nr:DUF4159 domain-containing protein [Longimicrobiales bacterium]
MSALRLAALLAGGLAVATGGYAVSREVPWGGAASEAPAPAGPPTPQDIESLNSPYDGKVHFVRIMYTPARRGRGFGRGFGGREPMWAHDYPRGERNFMKIIDEMTDIHPLVDGSNILALDDPRLFLYPIAYIVEVGSWEPTDTEVEGLSQYLQKGGFLIVDDFRDPWNLSWFMEQMGKVLPGTQFVELDGTHEIFDSFFRIDPHQVIPPYGPQTPVWYGLFEDNDPEKRLMVIVNYDNDISEYWEFSDLGYYPIDLSNEAYKLGVNYLVYALTH